MSHLGAEGLSEHQRAVLLDACPRVLVSAGAGSGKTRLLVACFVHALVEGGLPLERLVAITFTRKAGAELLSRIRSRLEELGRLDLARSLDTAMIGTIHSLCRRMLKERALAAGVDPAFTVLEAETAALAKEQICRQAWNLAIEEADDHELEVFASWGEGLRRQVVPLYDRLRGMGCDLPQVVIPPGSTVEVVGLELAELVRVALAAGREAPRRSATLTGDLEALASCLAWLEDPVAGTDGGDDLRATERFFPSRKTPAMEQYFGPVRTALTLYRCALAEIQLRPVVDTTNRLLALFDELYEGFKRERGLLDFADLELRARALLADPGANEVAASKLRRAVPASIPAASAEDPSPALVLIDEFQDTNELQCAILERLGAARLLMVGDEHQSIYRFRGADVEVFRRREKALASTQRGAAVGGLYRLDVNYRSCPEVLAFINRLFGDERFFGSSFVPLKAGRGRGEGTNVGSAEPAVQVLVVGRRQNADPEAVILLMQEAEAGIVAAAARRLMDDQGWKQRDIVVLLPAQTHVGLYREALSRRGIDVYVVRGKGYYSQEEVSDVASLLRILVNPHDDLSLVAVLRSPVAGLSDDGLYVLGRAKREMRAHSLWQVIRDGRVGALEPADRRRLADLTLRLAELRPVIGRPGLSRLIDEAVGACGYDVCLLASPEGKRRFANVRKLMRMADDFEALGGPDLAGFVDLIQSMGELSDHEGSAPTLAEGEDVVRVMTVHQAKGLEFPVVVLAGLGSEVPRVSNSGFAVGADGRMGVFLKGSRRATYEAEDLCWGPAAEIVAEERTKEQQEDARLLYVAMTRAQERLVLVGARPRGDRAGNSRIERITSALGLEPLPEEGNAVPLEGMEAVLLAVAPVAAVPSAAAGEPIAAASAGAEALASCPRFLEMAPAGCAPRRVSFSALAAYQRCPRHFYLEGLLGLGQASAPTAGEEADAPAADEVMLDDGELRAGRDVGLLVHALLEEWPLAEGPPAAGLLQAAAQDALQRLDLRLPPADLARALRLTAAFWDSPFAGQGPLGKAMREAPFFFARDDVLVSGVMDLIWFEGDEWHIVDYKTNALGETSPAEVAVEYQLQAVVYGLAALQAGGRKVSMDFLFLERPAEPVTAVFERADISRLEGLLDEALAGLRRSAFPARSGEACSWCSVADVCANMTHP